MRKESKGRILNEQFDFNPKNRKCHILLIINHCPKRKYHNRLSVLFSIIKVIAITPKPTQVRPDQAAATSTEAGAEEELKVLQDKLETLKRQPKKKFNYPQTAAQEVGWDMDTEFNKHAPRYGLNKASCPETQYANDYVTMTTLSPFAAPRPNVDQGPKK